MCFSPQIWLGARPQPTQDGWTTWSPSSSSSSNDTLLDDNAKDASFSSNFEALIIGENCSIPPYIDDYSAHTEEGRVCHDVMPPTKDRSADASIERLAPTRFALSHVPLFYALFPRTSDASRRRRA